MCITIIITCLNLECLSFHLLAILSRNMLCVSFGWCIDCESSVDHLSWLDGQD